MKRKKRGERKQIRIIISDKDFCEFNIPNSYSLNDIVNIIQDGTKEKFKLALNEEIADFLGIKKNTITYWRNKKKRWLIRCGLGILQSKKTYKPMYEYINSLPKREKNTRIIAPEFQCNILENLANKKRRENDL
ncbi:MAG: hypothetical protein LBK92_03815 [Endomicrobium sp.]|jgi:hypothetical protein|nr:hypothetical protein [Endomicrobium sp.]